VIVLRARWLSVTSFDFPSRLALRSPLPAPRHPSLRVQVSAQKSDADEAKGRTLEELTKVVVEFNGLIRQKKERLGPLISQLRRARQTHADLLQDGALKRTAYEALSASLDTSVRQQETRQAQLA